MSSLKDLKLAQKAAAQQRALIAELQNVVRDIERCERTITELRDELAAVNARHPSPRTTRQDIDYLTELLRCANKKLAWEKLMGSVQKRTPELLEKMSKLLEDPANPPQEQTRTEIARVLEAVRSAMERLKIAKVE